MEKYFYLFTLLVLTSATLSCRNQDQVEKEDDLCNFLQGGYSVIGKKPDSDVTYSGSVVITRADSGFKIERRIGEKMTEGTGKVESATADRIPVLRIRFDENGEKYESTYSIQADLDNSGRLTGYVYLKNGKTKKPGLEAWFSDPGVVLSR